MVIPVFSILFSGQIRSTITLGKGVSVEGSISPENITVDIGMFFLTTYLYLNGYNKLTNIFFIPTHVNHS